jgi:hypothetical protein
MLSSSGCSGGPDNSLYELAETKLLRDVQKCASLLILLFDPPITLIALYILKLAQIGEDYRLACHPELIRRLRRFSLILKQSAQSADIFIRVN